MAPWASSWAPSASASSTSSSSSSSSAASASPLSSYPLSRASPQALTRFSCYSSDPSDLARGQLDTALTYSSLRDLAATSSIYNSPSRPTSPTSTAAESWHSPNPSSSPTRPIPIPKRRVPACDDEPVIPLTGRFDKGFYFPRIYPPAEGNKHQHQKHRRRHSRMRADHPTFRSRATSPAISPSRRPSRPASPQQSRRTQNPSKSVPTFHLENLPRFHPAVYQSSGGSPGLAGQPPSPRASRQSYRPSPGARDGSRPYREMVESVSRSVAVPFSPGPSAPRLGPLQSPGPVTPLALEEAGGYLGAGAAYSSEHSARDKQPSGAGSDVVEMMIAREIERARQKAKVSAKGR